MAPLEGNAPTTSTPSKDGQECVSVALFFLETTDITVENSGFLANDHTVNTLP